MNGSLRPHLVPGYERVCAWATLLDRINVFPVADGDTGRNLRLSFAPLRCEGQAAEAMKKALLVSARGNSGNIGVRFVDALVTDESSDLASLAALGRDQAYAAVGEPKQGTMLSLFDALVEALEREQGPVSTAWARAVMEALEVAVERTPRQLPVLAEAGVVDSGALGMYLFLDGFLHSLAGDTAAIVPLADRFGDLLRVVPRSEPAAMNEYCVDVVLDGNGFSDDALRGVAGLGESAVTLRQGGLVKLHLHTHDRGGVRRQLESMGRVMRWSDDDLGQQTRRFGRPLADQAVHVVTDAAGSVRLADAERLGMSVLDSQVMLGELSVPENHLEPEDLYRAMREGVPVSTAQASTFERQQHYRRLLAVRGQVLYLCVGSVYTGNYEVARRWADHNDAADRFRVLDSGAASGKLGIVAQAAARRARTAADPQQVEAFALHALSTAVEYIYIDRLRYLAAGGRLSKTGAFFGDLFGVRPVVTPTPEGAQKVGVVRRGSDPVPHALARIDEALGQQDEGDIMLQYTDNIDYLSGDVLPRVAERFPGARVTVQPISLTTGAHVGPGTWAVAVLPDPV